jgi:hypothetical protein
VQQLSQNYFKEKPMPAEDMSKMIGTSSSPAINSVIQENKNNQQPITQQQALANMATHRDVQVPAVTK